MQTPEEEEEYIMRTIAHDGLQSVKGPRCGKCAAEGVCYNFDCMKREILEKRDA